MGYTITNRINVLIKKTYYHHERFQVDSTFALLYHENPLSVVEFSQYVRISDHLIQVDDHHYFIIFAFTSQDNAYKAAQNIIHKLDNHFNATSSCIALDTFNANIAVNTKYIMPIIFCLGVSGQFFAPLIDK